MFPAPRQRWVDAMVTPDEEIAGISAPTLVVHGREDRVIPSAQLHVYGHCGHWTQIEWAEEFARLVSDFLVQPAR
jgi:2-hydroxymuconate-semialdehyde hydrolase